MIKESKYNIEINCTDKEKILYNTRTGMMIRVSDKAYQSLKNVQHLLEPEKDPYISSFIRRGFCVPSKINESDHFYRQYLRFLQADAEELNFNIAVTTACNYRCIYCFEEGAVPVSMKAETMDAICNFIEQAAASSKCRSIAIKWFGGEPLLGLSAISVIGNRILNYCALHHLTFRTRIITNGALLTSEALDTLCRFNLVSVQISLDGTCEDYCHYKGASPKAYHTVMEIIRTQCQRVHFNIRLNCLPGNFDSILALTDELYADPQIRENISLYLAPVECTSARAFTDEEFADAQLTFLQHLSDLGWYSQVRNIMPSMRTSPCYNLQPGNYTIDPAGNLFACEAHLGNPDKRMSHVKENPQNVLDQKQTLCCSFNETLSSQCRECSYFPLCFSGCPRQRRNSQSCTAFQRQVLGTLRLISQIHE